MIPTPNELQKLKKLNETILAQLQVSGSAHIDIKGDAAVAQLAVQAWRAKGWVAEIGSARNEDYLLVSDPVLKKG